MPDSNSLAPSGRVAVVDVGSNSLRLVVFERLGASLVVLLQRTAPDDSYGAIFLLGVLIVATTYWQSWATASLQDKQDNAIQRVVQFTIARGLIENESKQAVFAANKKKKVSGQTLPDYVRDHILTPLKLSHTSFPTDNAFPEPHAQGYTLGTDDKEVTATDWNPSWGWAAGAMISTLDDMRIWADALASDGEYPRAVDTLVDTPHRARLREPSGRTSKIAHLLGLLLMPGAGLEPARPEGHPILSRARMTSFATPAVTEGY